MTISRIRTIFTVGVIALAVSGCQKNEKSEYKSADSSSMTRQTGTDPSITQLNEAKTNLPNDIKANSVKIADEIGVETIGEINFSAAPGANSGNASGPIVVMIFRVIAPQDLQVAKEWGVKVGGAYIQKSQTEYEYIRDVDLSKSNDELARQFGVKSN